MFIISGRLPDFPSQGASLAAKEPGRHPRNPVRVSASSMGLEGRRIQRWQVPVGQRTNCIGHPTTLWGLPRSRTKGRGCSQRCFSFSLDNCLLYDLWQVAVASALESYLQIRPHLPNEQCTGHSIGGCLCCTGFKCTENLCIGSICKGIGLTTVHMLLCRSCSRNFTTVQCQTLQLAPKWENIVVKTTLAQYGP